MLGGLFRTSIAQKADIPQGWKQWKRRRRDRRWNASSPASARPTEIETKRERESLIERRRQLTNGGIPERGFGARRRNVIAPVCAASRSLTMRKNSCWRHLFPFFLFLHFIFHAEGLEKTGCSFGDETTASDEIIHKNQLNPKALLEEKKLPSSDSLA